MNRSAVTVVVLSALVVVSLGTVGAFGAPPAVGDASVASNTVQAEDGNATNATETPTPAASDGTGSETGDDSNVTLGASVSSFMQANAADAENDVDAGMFDARFERSNASERARLVRQRTNSIHQRIQTLQQERQQLVAQETLGVKERAQAARLTAQARGLQSAVNQTAAAAERANVRIDRTALEDLRTNARGLTGPEVAAIATGLVDKERGPPEDRPGNGDNGQGNPVDVTTNGNETNAPGRSGDAGSGKGGSGGPPSDAGSAANDGSNGANSGRDSGSDAGSTPTPTPTPGP